MPNNPIDITGKVFGRLTAIRMLDKRWRKNVVWELECSCGTIVERSITDVQKGKKLGQDQSCGCAQALDLTGLKFGMLTAIRRLRLIPGKGFDWEFKCECGQHVVKNGASVRRRNGAARHCGCVENRGSTANNLEGQRFGKLAVGPHSHSDQRGRAHWKCRCDCGQEIIVSGFSLRRGKVSCGCDRKRGYDNPHFKGHEGIYRSYWTSMQSGAKSRKIEFDLSIEDAWELFIKQGKRCALSGLDIEMKASCIQGQTASLDRMDSTKGYTICNVQWVHRDLNRMKWNLSDERFIEICKLVAAYRS